MSHDTTYSASGDGGFEPDERPTRPSAPRPEQLEEMRASRPARARVLARRRPAVQPDTQAWLALKTRSVGAPARTATSRWRAIATALLELGSVRESIVDTCEAAPASTPTPTEPCTRAGMDLGPGGTVRMPPVAPRVPMATVRIPRLTARGDSRDHALFWLMGATAALVLATWTWIALDTGPRSTQTSAAPAAANTAAIVPERSAITLVAGDAPVTPAAAGSASASTSPYASPAPRRTTGRGGPRRGSPHAGSGVF